MRPPGHVCGWHTGVHWQPQGADQQIWGILREYMCGGTGWGGLLCAASLVRLWCWYGCGTPWPQRHCSEHQLCALLLLSLLPCPDLLQVFTITTPPEQEEAADATVRKMSPGARLTYALAGTRKYELPVQEVTLPGKPSSLTGCIC